MKNGSASLEILLLLLGKYLNYSCKLAITIEKLYEDSLFEF